MPERADPSELELIGFVRTGYATHVEKVLNSYKPRWLAGLGRRDHLYHLMALAEMLAWIRLGEAIGYFKEGSAERLWQRTDPRIKNLFFNGPRSSVLLRIGSDWGWTPIQMIARSEWSRPFGGIFQEGDYEWLWVRTGLLLAQQFGRARAVKGFLAALIGYSDREWDRTIDILMRGIEGANRSRTVDRLIATLRETASNEDGDIGAFGPGHFQLLAGFLCTVDHLAAVSEHSSEEHSSRVGNIAASIRRARLNFTNGNVHRRFLEIAGVAARVCDEARKRLRVDDAASADDLPSRARLLLLMGLWSGEVSTGGTIGQLSRTSLGNQGEHS